jgi:hypothetical protein
MEDNFYMEFDEAMSELVKTISSFSPEQFNTIPFEGSWTAGQVAEHLLKSNAGIQIVLHGNTKSTERNSVEKVKTIKAMFLDFSIKMKSPPSIIPSEEPKDRERVLNKFKTFEEDIKQVMNTADLSRTFTDYPFPQLGEFTGFEWICFAVCHAKRHTWQMKNILKALEKKQVQANNKAV